ncbi:MAG: hypothetical protein D6771_09330 [Zetaproteobacteria bacterium]|nr:MAG: hypothetical protein D6771_09330 [Zetaproteobacteria bacterium]
MARVASMVALALAFAAPAAPAQEGSVKAVRLLIAKMRESLEALKDLDKLERAGMPHEDVETMRSALRSKLDDMMQRTLREIGKL